MARRMRDYIPLTERLAAALACLIPPIRRDELRRERATAKYIISLFTYDHIHLHSLGGSDHWYNLDPRLRGPALKAKDSADTTRVAKVRRLEAEFQDFRRRVLGVHKKRKAAPRWPKRKIRNRKDRP
jgi:hypothetical protein